MSHPFKSVQAVLDYFAREIGWTEYSQLFLLSEFIEQQNQLDDLVAFLTEKAQEES